MFQPLAETARLVIYKEEEIVNDLETEWIESTGCAQNDDKSRGANCLMFGPYGHCTRSNLCSKNCEQSSRRFSCRRGAIPGVLARIEQLELQLGIRASIGI